MKTELPEAQQLLSHLPVPLHAQLCEASRRRGMGAAVDANVRITGIHLVGLYALQLVFNDGHERGIFPWQQLRQL